jgi:hypothetical protein
MPAGTSFIISEGMIADKIEKTEFDGTSYYRIGLKNQLLHAVHPLGWICGINLKIDGKAIPKEDVYFEVRDQWVGIETMHTIKDIYWYIMEEAHLLIKNKIFLHEGSHKIECEFVASQMEVSTQLDVQKLWARRRQTIVQTAIL